MTVLDMAGDPAARTEFLRRSVIAMLGVFVLGHIFLGYAAEPRLSGDLLPLYLAGQALAEGAVNEIYAPVENVFRMLPPENWADRARSVGYEGFVYPFVYPPLWAWVFGLLGRVADFQTVAAWASVLNPALLLATCLLARRASGAGMGVFPYVVVAHAALYMTPVGAIAILQNQAQIGVSFLVVLALERARANRPVAAGTAMALAASIKLFPAVFALFWLVSRERQAFASFVLAGLALGLLSVLVAGWPLHAEFLSHVASIARTGFFSPLSFSLDGVVAKLVAAEPGVVVLASTDPGCVPPQTILVSEKPSTLVHAAQAAVWVLVIAFGFAIAGAGRATRYGAVWPAALALLPLTGAIAWGYYFIGATAFAPVLLSRFGVAWGGAVLLLVYAPLHYGSLEMLGALAADFQIVGALSFLWLGFAFLVSAGRGSGHARKTPPRPLHPQPACL